MTGCMQPLNPGRYQQGLGAANYQRPTYWTARQSDKLKHNCLAKLTLTSIINMNRNMFTLYRLYPYIFK